MMVMPEEKQGFFAKFSRISRWLFWALIAAALLIIAVIGFYFHQYFTGRDITFSLKAPQDVLLAAPFNIEIDVSNNSDKHFKDINLSLILPEGTAFAGESPQKRVLNENLGDLDKNSALQKKIPIIILEGEQAFKRLEVVVSYFPPSLGPKGRFEQTKSVDVAVRGSAIKLDLITPQKVLNSEEFEIEVHYQNISDTDFSGVELELDYPKIFTFENATIKPASGNNFWKIGDLIKRGPKDSLLIQGKVIGAEKSFFKIESSLKITLSGQKYVINKKAAEINIAPSPLSIAVSLNNQVGYLTHLDDRLKYIIAYQNNSDMGLNDMVVKAKLTGEMFDFTTLRSAGFFSSKDGVITWNAANTPALRLINPGVEGAVEFEIETKNFYPIKRVSDKNFILKVEAEISSPTVPYYVASEKTIGLAKLETKVAGRITVNSEAVFLKGVWPPKVNKPTVFTVRWTIVNYPTDVKNIEIKAFLQSGAKWFSEVKSNLTIAPTYNERTQEIVWQIDRIAATKGITSRSVEASFQMEITPSITQVNQPLPLLSETTIKGIDEFTNLELRSSFNALSTRENVLP